MSSAVNPRIEGAAIRCRDAKARRDLRIGGRRPEAYVEHVVEPAYLRADSRIAAGLEPLVRQDVLDAGAYLGDHVVRGIYVRSAHAVAVFLVADLPFLARIGSIHSDRDHAGPRDYRDRYGLALDFHRIRG